MLIKPGDIFFTRGGGWLSKQIRWATRDKSEPHRMVNHVGVFVQDGDFVKARGVEALWKVRVTTPAKKHKGSDLAVFRCELTDEQEAAIISYLYAHRGQRYGWWKIGFHLADKLFKTRWFSRRLRLDSRPICSYLVAKAYAEAGLDFGVSPGSATPDDVWDFCWENPQRYQLVRELRKV